MPIKIRRSQRKLIALTITERTKPIYFRLLNRLIKGWVTDIIEAGRSPVEQRTAKTKNSGGSPRFQNYSDDYQAAIKKGRVKNKKLRPVNLKLTGKMLSSIKSKKHPNFVKVWFDDKKAVYHDKEGAGKAKVIRRMLPDGSKGEQFSTTIQKKIIDLLLTAIKLSKK